MDCKFCLTASQDFKRNLLPSEIAGQLIALKHETPEGIDIKNIVMMGMGWTARQLWKHSQTINILTCDFGLGISNRKITVSTCGLAPQIIQLGLDICINLAVSLNAADDETRAR